MSDTLILVILCISELALIATGLAVYLFLRNRRISQESVDTAQPAIPESLEPTPQLKFSDYLQQNIEQTKQKLAQFPDEQTRVLEARINFLQAEAIAQEHADDETAYWQQLIDGLDALLPQNNLPEYAIPEIVDSLEEDEPTLNELDDIDIQDSFDQIPVLKDNINDPRNPRVSIETANDDMESLRKIISRQYTTMDELKKSLQEKDIDIENNRELSKKLEEIEVAQAQLSLCVETLEKENGRLNELIKDYEDSPHQEQLTQAKQELEEANERINTLEKENSQQAARIIELESEIDELKKALEQRNRELKRMQKIEVDLSQIEDGEEFSQDHLLQEIESLTELISQKSEELSKLQSESTDEFDFDLPDEAAKPDKDKAVGTG